MKSRILPLLVFILVLSVLLSSCTVRKPDNDTVVQNGNFIYGDGSTIQIVIPGGNEKVLEAADDIQMAMMRDTTSYIYLVDDTVAEKAEHEIVIGKANREISTKAYEKLNRIGGYDEKSAFLMYSDGSSIAIAFEEDAGDVALTAAVEYFLKNYVKNELYVKSGVVCSQSVYMTKYIDEKDQEYLDKKWAALEERIGLQATKEIRALYILYSDDLVDWFANLYDPGVGGIYFSYSALKSSGFLPDLESTLQGTGFISASGMLMQTGEDLFDDFLPQAMKEEMIRYIKGLQNPDDGYFYHPQWGRNVASSRKSRDLGHATNLLKNLGSAPTYDAPNGTKGDGILADGTSIVKSASALTGRLDLNTALAVASVTSTSGVSDPRFESADTFMAYIESNFGKGANRQIEKHSYSVGNELTSMTSEIKARDAQLKAEGKETIAPKLIEWLNSKQNIYGHWQYEVDANGNLLTDSSGKYIPKNNYDNDRDANNGLLKILGIYEAFGYVVPRSTEAAETAIGALISDAPLNHICDVYNTWLGLNQLRRILVGYGGYEGKLEYEALKERLLQLAPEAIKATNEKLQYFRMIDGSFAYLGNSVPSSGLSQNANVSVPGLLEGDVNASRIAIDTITNMYDALGIRDYFVPIFTRGDAIRYKGIIERLNPYEKPILEYDEPEVLDSTYLGTGIYKDEAYSYDGTTVIELAESGFINTNYPEYLKFDDKQGSIAVNIREIKDNAVMEFINYYHIHDPRLLFGVKDKTVWDNNDSYIIETDFMYEYGTRIDGEVVAEMFLQRDKTNIWYDATLEIRWDDT